MTVEIPTASKADKPAAKQKAVASNVNVSFLSLMNITVELLPVKAKDDVGGFKMCCPDCTEAVAVKQQYVCTDPNHGPYTSGTAGKAKEVDGKLHKVSKEEIDKTKADLLPPGDFVVNIYPAADVEAKTMPNGVAYRMNPKAAGSMPGYGVLRELVSDSTRAFVGELTVKGQQKLFRVVNWNNQLVAQELARPELLAPVDNIPAAFDGKLLSTATMLADTMVDEFDPEAFKDQVRQRIADLANALASEEGGTPIVPANPSASPKGDATDDLIARMEAMVAAAKVKEAAAS